jgi:dTDP-glucose 4,6-dehydratase
MKVLVTGGAGFIGSAVIRYLIKEKGINVVNIDCLTYSGNLLSLEEVNRSDLYSFRKVDISDSETLRLVFEEEQPNAVINLAAESSVDRSIESSSKFIETNIVGTYTLLEETRHYWEKLESTKKKEFRFHQISTDEVFGSLSFNQKVFDEESRYNPSSPYSASKASSDHLVRAWGHTYGLPVIISHCSNNYGPYQFPEKLIPSIIIKAIRGEQIPIYGDGNQIRDWLHVTDHVKALILLLEKGRVGETYIIGGNNQMTNNKVAELICEILEQLRSKKPNGVNQYSELIQCVEDRPGHDFRYAVDIKKIQNEFGWQPQQEFESGLRKTVDWYISNKWWWERLI